MKKVLVIHPVTTAGLEEKFRDYFAGLARGHDLAIDSVHLKTGPASVETYFDEGFSLQGVLDVVAEAAGRYDGVMINCFADPGVEAARELVDIPVVGPAEASMRLATTLGHKFSVVSTFRNSGPWVERQARALELEARLASAVGVEIPVLELGRDPGLTARVITEAAREAVTRDGAEVIVLGCTCMAEVAKTVREEVGVPVVEPAAAAVRMLQALLDLGLTHSKIGVYRNPLHGTGGA